MSERRQPRVDLVTATRRIDPDDADALVAGLEDGLQPEMVCALGYGARLIFTSEPVLGVGAERQRICKLSCPTGLSAEQLAAVAATYHAIQSLVALRGRGTMPDVDFAQFSVTPTDIRAQLEAAALLPEEDEPASLSALQERVGITQPFTLPHGVMLFMTTGRPLRIEVRCPEDLTPAQAQDCAAVFWDMVSSLSAPVQTSIQNLTTEVDSRGHPGELEFWGAVARQVPQ